MLREPMYQEVHKPNSACQVDALHLIKSPIPQSIVHDPLAAVRTASSHQAICLAAVALMATCTSPAPAAVITDPGKEKGLWLPVLAQEKDGEEKEKPLVRLAPTIAPADLVQPETKTRRPPVPITDEERKKLMALKEMHRSAAKELQELQETRNELRKKRDDLLFRQRCLAARLVDWVIFQRRDAAYVRHERRIGLKPGDDLPEELGKARRPLTMALFLYNDMGRALEIGLDKFLVEYADQMEHYKKEVEA